MEQEAFSKFGGRKFFGLLVMALLMVVVAVFGNGLSTELAGGLVALYVAFVGGNSFTTAKTFSEGSQDVTYNMEVPAAQPPVDMQPYVDAINGLQTQVDEARETASQAGNAVVQMNQQLQALKNLTAAAIKSK